jgi:hypothetical protein
MSHRDAIVRLLGNDEPIARADVDLWLEAHDLETWGALHALLEAAATRITPPLSPIEIADFTARYLIRCLEESPRPAAELFGNYQAAWALASHLKSWRRQGGKLTDVVRRTALELARMYRRTDPATKNIILCGVMEHAFEDPALRPHFNDWDRDPELREAFNVAMEWGVTHEE